MINLQIQTAAIFIAISLALYANQQVDLSMTGGIEGTLGSQLPSKGEQAPCGWPAADAWLSRSARDVVSRRSRIGDVKRLSCILVGYCWIAVIEIVVQQCQAMRWLWKI